MTREQFRKAKDIVSKITIIDGKLSDLYNNELTVNKESNNREWSIHGIFV